MKTLRQWRTETEEAERRAADEAERARQAEAEGVERFLKALPAVINDVAKILREQIGRRDATPARIACDACGCRLFLTRHQKLGERMGTPIDVLACPGCGVVEKQPPAGIPQAHWKELGDA